jgi:signal transduction histidine kinase
MLSYGILTLAFALVAGWGVFALRSAAREADLMRSGYLPLARTLGDLVARQDTWNTQLNHITTARNPADIQIWFESMLRIGRPKKFGEARAAISRTFMASRDASVRSVGAGLLGETSAIERFLNHDGDLLVRIFEALKRGDAGTAESLRDQLVTRGYQGARRLGVLEQRMQHNVESLLDAARARERLAIELLLALSGFTLLVGVAMVLYARRVLRPLTAVTERAKAVARGDLTPRSVPASNDEIGELAATFEGMVSAIARANEQLLATERLATIGKMAAHVTHEIRNPLSSIALNVEMLEEEVHHASAESRTLVRAIKNEVERLTALSEQYLSVARRQQFHLELEDVGEVIQEACDFMRRDVERSGVQLSLEIEPELPLILADEAQLKQALINLVRNAREAMPSGGKVSVGVKRAAGTGVDITVDDEGPGIAAGAQSRLFEPFFTTKGHGTGLGLAITRQIVEAHSGTIACESRAQGGARFWIHLPGREPPSRPAPAATEPAQEDAVLPYRT